MAYKAQMAEYKKKDVNEYVKLINDYPIIGAVNLEGMPAAQLSKMRAKLRGTVVMKMGKRRLMNLAIEAAKDKKKGLEKLKESLEGMPALIFTKENPFKLFKELEKSKSAAPAKAGQKSPKDIIIPAGPTSFAPGPIISQLGGLGIKSGIVDGKVEVKEDALVAKEGDVISQELAGMLVRFGIEPMEIGLNLTSVYEDGEIFTKKVLAVDDKEYIANIENASRWAFNLAMECAYPAKEVVEVMIQKSYLDAKALAVSEDILADAVISDILVKAQRQAESVKATAKQ